MDGADRGAEGYAGSRVIAEDDPDVAAVLAIARAVNAAVVGDDHAAFEDAMGRDLVVNTPANRVSDRAQVTAFGRSGLISYASLERTHEYAASRPGGVLLMGGEVAVPKGATRSAGHAVRRRFTEFWAREDGGWKLQFRQATVIEVT